jgi:hypothetical protein
VGGILAAIVLVCVTRTTEGREPFSISGTWKLVADDAARAPDAATQARWDRAFDGFCGPHCEIVQTVSLLTIVRDQYLAKPKVVIKLDGSESLNSFQTPDGAITVKSVATLGGQSLRIQTDYRQGDVQSRQDVTIIIDRGQLVVTRQLRRGRGPGDVRTQRYARRE